MSSGDAKETNPTVCYLNFGFDLIISDPLDNRLLVGRLPNTLCGQPELGRSRGQLGHELRDFGGRRGRLEARFRVRVVFRNDLVSGRHDARDTGKSAQTSGALGSRDRRVLFSTASAAGGRVEGVLKKKCNSYEVNTFCSLLRITEV